MWRASSSGQKASSNGRVNNPTSKNTAGAEIQHTVKLPQQISSIFHHRVDKYDSVHKTENSLSEGKLLVEGQCRLTRTLKTTKQGKFTEKIADDDPTAEREIQRATNSHDSVKTAEHQTATGSQKLRGVETKLIVVKQKAETTVREQCWRVLHRR